MRYAKKYLDKKILFPLFAGFLAFILVKAFCIDFVVVRSPAMQPALRPGEYLFITRIFTPHRGDVVEISLPITEKDTSQEKIKLFKRIAAMPGDTFEVRESKLYINGQVDSLNESFLHNYIAKIRRQADSVVFDQVGITERFLVDDSCVYLVMLNNDQYRSLEAQKEMFSLESNSEDSAIYDETVFPFDPEIKWNKDYYGPLYIPKKDDDIQLTPSNVKYYERIIHDFEGNALEVEKGKIYINENEVTSYKVKDDYYFVIGDNFDNSVDSRQWGFIPREKITARTLRKK